jgi:hypothetical protein
MAKNWEPGLEVSADGPRRRYRLRPPSVASPPSAITWTSSNADLSPDKQFVLENTGNGTVDVHRISDGVPVAQIPSGTAYALSTDGKFVYTSGDGTLLKAWLWRARDLLPIAATLVSRNLTHDEQVEFLGGYDFKKLRPDLP